MRELWKRFVIWNARPMSFVEWLTIVFVSVIIGMTWVILLEIGKGS